MHQAEDLKFLFRAEALTLVLPQTAAKRLRERVRQAEAAREEVGARAHVLQQQLELGEAGGSHQGAGFGYVRQAAAARDEAEARARVLQQRLDLAEEAAAAKLGMPGLELGLGAQHRMPLAARVPPAPAARPVFYDRASAGVGTVPAMPDPDISAEREPPPAVPAAATGPPAAIMPETVLLSMPAGSVTCPTPSGRSATRSVRQGVGGNPLRSPTLSSLEVLVAGTEAMVAQTLAADVGLASGRRTPRREGALFGAGPGADGPPPVSSGRDADAENAGSTRPVLPGKANEAGHSEAAPAVGGAGSVPAAAARSRRQHAQGAEAAAITRLAARGRETPKIPSSEQAAAARKPLTEVSPQRQVPLAAGAAAPPATKAPPPRGRRDAPSASPKPKTPSPGLAARMRAGLFGGTRRRCAVASLGAKGAGSGAGRGGAGSGVLTEVDASLCLHGSPMSPPATEEAGELLEAAAASRGEFCICLSPFID